jgi:Tfp pilus assembly protein PilX
MADQKGMAVVVALLVLALLSLLGITLMGLSVTESQIGSNEADLKKAFFAAEAGIQEALYRMRLDPASYSYEVDPTLCAATDPVVVGFVQAGTLTVPSLSSGIANSWKYNPFATPACSWTYSGLNTTDYGNYFGKNPANLDSAGRRFRFCAAGDTSAYCTSANYAHKIGNQLANANIINTASDPLSYTVTVAPVVGYVGNPTPCWQYVNQFGTPRSLKGSAVACDPGAIPKNPMYKVTSIGTAKTSQKVLSTMIQHYVIDPLLDGAVTANADVNIQSAAARFDGRNHDCNGDLLSPHGVKKAVTVPPGDTVTVNQDQNLKCSLTGTDTVTGVANCAGTSTPFPSTIGAFLLGPTAAIEEINAFNDYLESIKIAPPGPTSPFHGVVYVDGDYAQPPDGSTGVLIVHHRDPNGVNGCTNPGGCPVANLGNFNGGTFKGLIIADAMDINGNANIIGAVVTFANVSAGEGNPSINYSQCIIDGLAQNFMLHAVKGTWHEQ